jgi:hypothetical protein
MTSLYEALKASKTKRFPDYWTLLWGRKLSAAMIKTITGTLPLTFTAKGGNAVDWTISGNSGGVGERTKNSFEIIPSDQTITETGTLIFATNVENGTITANGTCGSSISTVKQSFMVTPELAGDYYFSGSFNQTSSTSTFDAYMYDLTAHAFIQKWDGTTRSPYIKGTESQEVKLIEGHSTELTFRVYKNTTVDNLVFKPMLRPADTTPEFIPYGYQVPITISQDGESDKSYEIFIGDAPLGEGETVSKTSTGIDIELFEGENTVSTTLTNKPEMTIKYK